MKKRQFILLITLCSIVALIVGYSNLKQKNDKVEDSNNEKYEKNINTKEKQEEYINVWTTANLNIREKPSVNSNVVDNYHWGTEITVTYVNEEWAKLKDTGYYVNRTFLCESPIGYSDYDVPSNNTIKSYMDYRTITSKISKQYKLQKIAYTGEYGIRKVGYRHCVALGSYYTTTIGQYVDIELENGNVIYGILADCKADKHTDSTNRMHPDGSVVELIVNTDCLDETAMKMGDLSYVNDWDSKVVNIRVYDEVVDF